MTITDMQKIQSLSQAWLDCHGHHSPQKRAPFFVILVPLESTFNTLFSDALDKAKACSQQRIQADQCGSIFH